MFLQFSLCSGQQLRRPLHGRSIVDGKPEGVFSEVAAAGIRARLSEVDAAGIRAPSEAAIGEVAVQDVRAPARLLSRASVPRRAALSRASAPR